MSLSNQQAQREPEEFSEYSCTVAVCLNNKLPSWWLSEWAACLLFMCWRSVSVWARLTSSALQVATLLAVSPRTSGSSWQCLSQQRATRCGGEAEMPGENTDSWRACWREMASGEAAGRKKGWNVCATRRVIYVFYVILTLHYDTPLPSPISSLT